jgi:hypothetical protein
MRQALIGLCGALLAALAISTTALACGFDQVTVERTMREADRIVLGTVDERAGLGLYTYTIRVERVIKGLALPAHWVIRDAGVSDCGMPLLAVGQRFVLEYYKPGRITTGPWFYGWRIEPDGTVALSDSHAPPLPATLDDLLALYAAAKPPDTSTAPSNEATGTDGAVPALLLTAGWILAVVTTLRRTSRQREARRGEVSA